MAVHEIDEHGDCTIHLGTDAQISILASAKVLMLASLVFSQMLSEKFREGQEYAAEEGVTLNLVDDNPQAPRRRLQRLAPLP